MQPLSNEKCFDLLIDAGADLTAAGYGGNTLLHVLAKCYNSHWEKFMDAVIAAGVDVNLQNEQNRTALYMVAESKVPDRLKVAIKLMQHGADPNIPDSQDRTPLEVLSRHNLDKKKLEQLFETGEINDVDEITEEERNMMYNASQLNNIR